MECAYRKRLDHRTAPRLSWPRNTTTATSETKSEGVNRSRGEAGETIHHLFMAKLKGYINQSVYHSFRGRYKECIRMLNGLEKSLEKHPPVSERRWPPER